MTRIVYEVVEHDGGWAYRVNGCSPKPSRPMTWPTVLRNAQRMSKSSLETRRASRTKIRMVVGTTKRRQAVIDPRPTSKVERIFRRRPANLGRRESRVADGGSTALRIGARWCMIAAPIYPQSVGPERMGTRWLTSIWK